MTTLDYTKKITDLRVRVSQHAKLDNNDNVTTSYSLPKINNNIFLYVVPTIILIFIFLVLKPSVVCTDHINKDNVIISKVNYKKIIIYSLIGGMVISIGIFAYFHKNKNNNNNNK